MNNISGNIFSKIALSTCILIIGAVLISISASFYINENSNKKTELASIEKNLAKQASLIEEYLKDNINNAQELANSKLVRDYVTNKLFNLSVSNTLILMEEEFNNKLENTDFLIKNYFNDYISKLIINNNLENIVIINNIGEEIFNNKLKDEDLPKNRINANMKFYNEILESENQSEILESTYNVNSTSPIYAVTSPILKSNSNSEVIGHIILYTNLNKISETIKEDNSNSYILNASNMLISYSNYETRNNFYQLKDGNLVDSNFINGKNITNLNYNADKVVSTDINYNNLNWQIFKILKNYNNSSLLAYKTHDNFLILTIATLICLSSVIASLIYLHKKLKFLSIISSNSEKLLSSDLSSTSGKNYDKDAFFNLALISKQKNEFGDISTNILSLFRLNKQNFRMLEASRNKLNNLKLEVANLAQTAHEYTLKTNKTFMDIIDANNSNKDFTSKHLDNFINQINSEDKDKISTKSRFLVDSMRNFMRQNLNSFTNIANNTDAISPGLNLIHKDSNLYIKSLSNGIENINVICDKLDLISLNTSIEASKLGDKGKGFKILAEQVNALGKTLIDTVNDLQNSQNSLNKNHDNLTNILHKLEGQKEVNSNLANSIKSYFTSQIVLLEQINKKSKYVEDVILSLNSNSDNINKTNEKIYNNSKLAEETTNSISECIEKIKEKIL